MPSNAILPQRLRHWSLKIISRRRVAWSLPKREGTRKTRKWFSFLWKLNQKGLNRHLNDPVRSVGSHAVLWLFKIPKQHSQWDGSVVRVPAAMPDNLSSNPLIHAVKGEKPLLRADLCPLSSDLYTCLLACAHTPTHNANECNIKTPKQSCAQTRICKLLAVDRMCFHPVSGIFHVSLPQTTESQP